MNLKTGLIRKLLEEREAEMERGQKAWEKLAADDKAGKNKGKTITIPRMKAVK